MTDATARPAAISAAEVARALDVHVSTVGRWIAAGRITAVKAFNGYQIPAAELDRLIAERAAKQT